MIGSPAVVLDASALLAYVHGERGASEVRKAFDGETAISAVNWAEVLSKLADTGLDPVTTSKRMREQAVIGSALVVWPFDERFALDVAGLRDQTRPYGLSLGDRACLALGSFLKVPILTADRKWGELKLRVALRFIR
jgi:ribonuclease VapC